MAFRFFSSKYITDFTTELSNKQSVIIALETIEKLKWYVDAFHDEKSIIIAFTRFSWRSWREEIIITINNGTITIESECIESQLTDFGKNKKNGSQFISTFNTIKEELSIADIEHKITELENNLKAAIEIE
ncbi:hypothetical protein [Aquimarina longa]|uniref:hypothetical protein n=1 Tax=Aquimarina longa TaxID=1080221 RepID=UPI000785FEA1|nr:hypothetical protein [Aquimarina longa]